MPSSSKFLREKLNDHQNKAGEIDEYFMNKREVSETYENFGLSLFYSGEYKSASENLIEAYNWRKEYAQDRGNGRLCLLAGISLFRIGDLSKSEEMLGLAISSSAAAQADDIVAISKCNLSLVYAHSHNVTKANEIVRDSIKAAATVFSINSQEYKNISRTAVSVYLMIEEHQSAQAVIRSTPFSAQEKALLLAACDPREAEDILSNYIKDKERKGSTLQLASNKLSEDGLLAVTDGELTDATMASGEGMESEDDLLTSKSYDALIEYNLAVFLIRRKRYQEALIHIQKSLAIAEEADALMREVDEGSSELEEYQVDPHAMVAGLVEGVSADLFSVDQLLAPRVILSQILAVKAETLLACKSLQLAVQLEAGRAVDNLEADDQVLRDIAGMLESSVDVLSSDDIAGLPSIYRTVYSSASTAQTTSSSRPGTRSGIDSAGLGGRSSLLESSTMTSSTATLSTKGGLSEKSKPSSKQKRKSISKLNSKSSKESSSTSQSAKAEDGLTSLPSTASTNTKPLSPSSSLMVNQEPSTSAPAATVGLYRNMDIVLASDIRDRYQHLLEMSLKDGNRDRIRTAQMSSLRHRHHVQFNKNIKRPSSRSQGKHKRYNDYGFESVRREIQPLREPNEDSECHAWIQWALSVTEGMGMGFMGMQGTSSDDENNVKLSPDFYRDVRARLNEVEETLSASDTASLLLLSCVQFKISTQLNLRKDAGQYLDKYEKYASKVEDPYHKALSKKFRIDFEEWDSSLSHKTSPVAKLKRCMTLLGLGKAYLHAAERTNDYQLQRDALKRIMNIFIETSKIPQPAGMTLVEGSQLELDDMSAEDIEVKENTDIYWIYRFSKIRARDYFKKLKYRHPKDETEKIDDAEDS